MVCCGWHTPWQYVTDDALYDTVEYFHTIENPYVIIPGLPKEMTGSYEQWLRNAELFNAASPQIIRSWIALGYHNHAGELRPFEVGKNARLLSCLIILTRQLLYKWITVMY